MAPTPSPKPPQSHMTPAKTPQMRHKLNFSPAITATPGAVSTEHPVEVIGRIRDHPEYREKPASPLEVSSGGNSVIARMPDGSYRDFALDGVSVAESEDLEAFYRRFIKARIEGVRLGAKCTLMMYGPTGSGKSHTMFGCTKQPGIVYHALRDILGEVNGEDDGNAGFGVGLLVQVAVLEIYNEEIYDLLSGSAAPGSISRGQTPKARLEVMGKKAKNATYICGNEAVKISKEVAKVEKRRIVKSTLCNERSSRSHCMIILDIPSVGGRLMLVDMAGSENIEAAGQTGFDAKMQTAKINQGNTALKRVVESIANGDSHVPFRDSKLTMLLQDSFEDDKSKILMILCASPDPKELHKTISTLEYGAKAKCIVRAAHVATPKEKMSSDELSVMLNARIMAMNQFISRLQSENKVKEKECNEAQKQLAKKEQELDRLRATLLLIEGQKTAKEDEINSKVLERTESLRIEMMKMEEKMLHQQEELNTLKRRLQESEHEKSTSCHDILSEIEGGRLMARLSEICTSDQSMVMSMELDMGDQPPIQDVKEIKEDTYQSSGSMNHRILDQSSFGTDVRIDASLPRLPGKVSLSTVFEGDEEGADKESIEDHEVEKEVVEENVEQRVGNYMHSEENESFRKMRIENIFRLCGNYREVAKQAKFCSPVMQSYAKKQPSQLEPDKENLEFPLSPVITFPDLKPSVSPPSKGEEKRCISSEVHDDVKVHSSSISDANTFLEVHVKEESTTDSSGISMKEVKLLKNASLLDLRKLIEAHLEENNIEHKFSFLLADPSGAVVAKENEASVPASKLPICSSNQPNSHLACLRFISNPATQQKMNHEPFGSLENTLQSGLHRTGAPSPKMGQKIPSYLGELRSQVGTI